MFLFLSIFAILKCTYFTYSFNLNFTCFLLSLTTSVSESSLRFGKCVQSIKTLTVNSHHYIHQNVTCKILLDWSRDVFSEYQIFIIFSHTKLDILVVKYCIGVRANSNCKELFETEVVIKTNLMNHKTQILKPRYS